MSIFNLYSKKLADAITADGQSHRKAIQERIAMNEMIDEIHETFFTEVDKLLADAKIFKEVRVENEEIIRRAERLERLGFKSTKDVKDAEKEKKRIIELEYENSKKKELVEVIEYFSQKYPLYKFITQDSVKKICKKYDLIYGDVAHYIGDVPEENLLDIEKFNIKDEDICYVVESRSNFNYGSVYETNHVNEYALKKTIKYNLKRNNRSLGIESDVNRDIDLLKNKNESIDYTRDSNYFERIYKVPLHIAAPKKDFNLRGLNVEDYEIKKMQEIPDPIVLCPVIWRGIVYFLIVTAWGKEALDEDVVNQKMN